MKGRAPTSLTGLSQFSREGGRASLGNPAAGRATQPTAFLQKLSCIVKVYSQTFRFLGLLAVASSWLVCGTPSLLEKKKLVKIELSLR